MAFEDLLEDPVVQKYLSELVGPKGMPVAVSPLAWATSASTRSIPQGSVWPSACIVPFSST